MKRLFASALLVIVAAVVVFGLAGRAPRNKAAFGQDFEPFGTVDPINGIDAQKQQLLERLKAKVELMSDEEIKQALESTNSEIRVMQAKQKLDQAAESLRAIVKEFDGTPSAQLAHEMLSVHERGPVPVNGFGDAPFYSPGADPSNRPTPSRRAG